MSLELLLRHVAALDASITQQQVGLELVASQLAGLKAYLKSLQPPTARIELRDTCQGVKEEECARLTEEAAIVRDGWDPMCRGCGKSPQ